MQGICVLAYAGIRRKIRASYFKELQLARDQQPTLAINDANQSCTARF